MIVNVSWVCEFSSSLLTYMEYSNSVDGGRSNRCKKVVAPVGLMYGTPAENYKKSTNVAIWTSFIAFNNFCAICHSPTECAYASPVVFHRHVAMPKNALGLEYPILQSQRSECALTTTQVTLIFLSKFWRFYTAKEKQ
jgi:hypothetical protein